MSMFPADHSTSLTTGSALEYVKFEELAENLSTLTAQADLPSSPTFLSFQAGERTKVGKGVPSSKIHASSLQGQQSALPPRS